MREIVTMNCRTTIVGSKRLLTKAPIVVYVTGEIDEAQFEAFTKTFVKAVASGQSIIPVVIHSTGGNIVEALGMASLMKGAPGIVATICTTQAYSAAAMLFMCGAQGHRFMGPNATVMLHQVSLMGISGTAREVNAEAVELTRVNEQSFQHMSRSIGRPMGYLSELVRAAGCDLYLTAEQCLHHGIANEICTPHLEVRLFADLKLVKEPQWTTAGRVMPVGGGTTMSSGGTKRKRGCDSDDDDSDDD